MCGIVFNVYTIICTVIYFILNIYDNFFINIFLHNIENICHRNQNYGFISKG